MMRLAVLLISLAIGDEAEAETLVALRTLRAKTVVSPQDVGIAPGHVPGALSSAAGAVGLETREVVYRGQPILPSLLGPPAIVERNQIVPLSYSLGSLKIVAEGRALDRGGVGERIKVMNAASRAIVSGMVASDGSILVTDQQ